MPVSALAPFTKKLRAAAIKTESTFFYSMDDVVI
jgi:hypothetical protein